MDTQAKHFTCAFKSSSSEHSTHHGTMSDDDQKKAKHVDMEEDDDSKIFPMRLHEILSEEAHSNAICWLPHGKAFVIRDRKVFAETVMPKFFSRKAKYSSFTRKLNRW